MSTAVLERTSKVLSETDKFWAGVNVWHWDDNDAVAISHVTPELKERIMSNATAVLNRRASQRTAHRDLDPNATCDACQALKKKMRAAAAVADCATDRFGNSVVRASKQWKDAYFAALSSK